MTDLSPLTYGKVVGRFLAIVGDTADGGDNPDAEPMVGTVTLTPSISSALVASASPPATILLRPLVITLNADGEIEWLGSDGIYVLATDDASINPTDFTYTASFDLSYGGETVPYESFSFQVDGGDTVDLTLVTPVAVSSGTLTIVGPAGPAFTWRGTWSSATAYVLNDAVEYSGSSYVAVGPSTNSQPDTNPSDWELFAAAAAGGISASTLTTKGDIYVATASATVTRLGAGTDGHMLIADSGATEGLGYARPVNMVPGSGMSGIPGRVMNGRSSAKAHTSNEVNFIYFETPAPISITTLQTDFSSVTGTGGLVRCAVYDATSYDTIGNLVSALGDLTVASGEVSQSITPVALPAGRYFLAIHSDFQGTITAMSTRARYFVPMAASASSYQNARYWTATLGSGAGWPTTFTLTGNNISLTSGQEQNGYAAMIWTE